MTQTPHPHVDRLREELFTRRRVTGIAVAGVSVPLLAACGADDGPADASSAQDSTGSSPSASSAPGGSSTGTASAAPEGLASTTDIEVGGGAIYPDEEIVITQPTAGEFKCFSAVCTHQGCLVSEVSDGEIICACHGSNFSISTGEPDSGPATEPLEEKQITVTGDQISLA